MEGLELKTGLNEQGQLGLSISPELGGEPLPVLKRSKVLLS